MMILLGFLVLSLVIFLALRLFDKRKNRLRVKAVFFSFLLLYVSLVYQALRWPDLPPDIFNLTFGLTVFGLLAFAIDSLSEIWIARSRLHRHLKRLKKMQGPFQELVAAANSLSQSKIGALVAIERRQSLETWYQKGIAVDALLTKEILFSLFTPPGDLHDGAAFIRGDRVAAAGVIVPLTSTAHFRKDLGTRHRAAVGMSEATDALCLVISEETGAVSLADRGVLYYGISLVHLPQVLAEALRFRLKKPTARTRSLPREARQATLLSSPV